MGRLVAGYASSHAFTFLDPSEWDGFRQQIRQGYARRYGALPAENPMVQTETPEGNAQRYARIRESLAALREQLITDGIDALIVVGDDQDENFTPDYMVPQVAVYTGPEFGIRGRMVRRELSFQSHQELARAILARGVEEDFDIAVCASFPDNKLASHAHYQILEHILGEANIPVVVVFVNAIHHPAPSPRRCLALGQMIARAVADRPEGERVAIFASGGLSHFTAGYPWQVYRGPFQFGDISVEFDKRILDQMRAGNGHALADLTSDDLLAHGDIELRSWMTVLGAVGPVVPRLLVYEPFFQAIQAMGVASWVPVASVYEAGLQASAAGTGQT